MSKHRLRFRDSRHGTRSKTRGTASRQNHKASVSRLFAVAAAALFVVTSIASAQTPFAPLTKWTDAVAAGNAQAVRSYYSANPPALIVVGKEQTREPDMDAAYWASLKADGITGIHPKVLSLETAQDKTQLVLRIQAQKFGQNLVASAV